MGRPRVWIGVDKFPEFTHCLTRNKQSVYAKLPGRLKKNLVTGHKTRILFLADSEMQGIQSTQGCIADRKPLLRLLTVAGSKKRFHEQIGLYIIGKGLGNGIRRPAIKIPHPDQTGKSGDELNPGQIRYIYRRGDGYKKVLNSAAQWFLTVIGDDGTCIEVVTRLTAHSLPPASAQPQTI